MSCTDNQTPTVVLLTVGTSRFVAAHQLLLLLFRHSAKSLNVQDVRLASSPQLVTRLHLPHAIVVRLHKLKSSVFTLIPHTTGTVGV